MCLFKTGIYSVVLILMTLAQYGLWYLMLHHVLFRFCQTVEVKTVPEPKPRPQKVEEEESKSVLRPIPIVPVRIVIVLALIFGILVSYVDTQC